MVDTNSNVDVNPRGPTAIITNNIFYSDGQSPYISVGEGTVSSQLKVSNNLYYNRGTGPSLDTAPVNGNPLFVNAAAKDFHLQAASPGIGKG